MKNILFFSLLLFASCSPQRQLADLIRKHPELVKTTVRDSVVEIPQIAIHDSTHITYAYSGNLDSLLNVKSDSLGFIKKEDCKAIATTVIKTVHAVVDTEFYGQYKKDSLTATYRVKIKTDKTSRLSVDFAVTHLLYHVPVEVNTIQPMPVTRLNFFQKIARAFESFLQWSGGLAWFIIICLIVVWVVTKKFPIP